MSALWPAVLLVSAALVLLRRPILYLLRLTVRSLGALVALYLLHPAGNALGIILGVNWLNALVLGLLGVPGLGLLLMLQWLLGYP